MDTGTIIFVVLAVAMIAMHLRGHGGHGGHGRPRSSDPADGEPTSSTAAGSQDRHVHG